MMITVSGPLGWLLSQILLLAYFKLDNGSNVCGLEFDFDNKGAQEKLEEKKENEEGENSTNDSEATNTSSADQSGGRCYVQHQGGDRRLHKHLQRRQALEQGLHKQQQSQP